MNNLCFGTVVPTTTSAKYNLDAGKWKKLSSAQKASKVGIVELHFFGTDVLAINNAEVQHAAAKENHFQQCQ